MNKKILIADDSVEIRKLLEAFLRKTSYEIIEAEDGKESIVKALETRPNVILMDIMMPVMDGIQATLELKNNPKTKNIPIIMLTAVLDSKAVLTSYDYGADYYLNKPIKKENLLKAIEFVEKMESRGI